MSLGEHRPTVVRVGIYLVALMVVVVLFRQRLLLAPPHGLRVTQVKETDRLDPIVAEEGEKLVMVGVRLIAPAEIQCQLRPSFFALLDADGHEHLPDSLSPLFSHELPLGQGQEVEGELVFHVPRGTVGKSLSFRPEVEDDAPDFKPEDFGPKGGP